MEKERERKEKEANERLNEQTDQDAATECVDLESEENLLKEVAKLERRRLEKIDALNHVNFATSYDIDMVENVHHSLAYVENGNYISSGFYVLAECMCKDKDKTFIERLVMLTEYDQNPKPE